ncbi:hypothetical protein MIMGU_mgv1a024493mg, partial [Erythranthe guttata]
TRSAKKKKLSTNAPITTTTNNEEEDIIRDLPDDVIDHICSYMSIKSVAQTSLLSKRWNNIWRSFPDLDFTTFAALTSTSTTTPAKLISNLRQRVQHHVSKGAKYANEISTLIEKRHSDIRAVKFQAFVNFSTLNRLIQNSQAQCAGTRRRGFCIARWQNNVDLSQDYFLYTISDMAMIGHI